MVKITELPEYLGFFLLEETSCQKVISALLLKSHTLPIGSNDEYVSGMKASIVKRGWHH